MKAVLVALTAVCLAACSASVAAQKHGDYDVTVVSVDRVREWQDPTNPNMRYSARPDGIILLVNIRVRTPNGKISLGETEIKAKDGKTYKSNRVSFTTSWPKEEPQTGEVTLPFIAPAGAEIETFSLESKTTIDIATLAANAKAAKP